MGEWYLSLINGVLHALAHVPGTLCASRNCVRGLSLSRFKNPLSRDFGICQIAKLAATPYVRQSRRDIGEGSTDKETENALDLTISPLRSPLCGQGRKFTNTKSLWACFLPETTPRTTHPAQNTAHATPRYAARTDYTMHTQAARHAAPHTAHSAPHPTPRRTAHAGYQRLHATPHTARSIRLPTQTRAPRPAATHRATQ